MRKRKTSKSSRENYTRNPLVTIGLMILCLSAVIAYIWHTKPEEDAPRDEIRLPDRSAEVRLKRTAEQPNMQEVYKASKTLMGTVVTVQVVAGDPGAGTALIDAAFAEFQRLEKLLSPFDRNSRISVLNRKAGNGPVPVGAELFHLLSESKKYSEITGGAFDVTWAALSPLWNFDARPPSVPSKKDLEEALKLVGYEGLELDATNGTARLAQEGMAVDLGGIAKGYAVDKAVQVLREKGCKSALVEAGGDLFAFGNKIGDQPWSAGIRDPRNLKELLGSISVNGEALATSGDYEHYFILDKVRYHHLLDPKTGMPARGAMSVSVLAGSAEEADALATGFFVMGPEKAMKLANRLKDVEILVVDSDARILMTPGLTKRFKRHRSP